MTLAERWLSPCPCLESGISLIRDLLQKYLQPLNHNFNLKYPHKIISTFSQTYRDLSFPHLWLEGRNRSKNIDIKISVMTSQGISHVVMSK